MRVTAIFVSVMLLVAGTAAAQEWEEFVSKEDGFKVDFPGHAEGHRDHLEVADGLCPSGQGVQRRQGQRTLLDDSHRLPTLEQQGIERAKTCEPGNAQCRQKRRHHGPGYWKHDERSALMYATFKFIQNATKLTEPRVGMAGHGRRQHLIQLTNPDESRTFAYVAMHENKLYMLEGTVPKGYPEPGLFQQSLGWVDKDGNGIRYQNSSTRTRTGMGVYPKPSPGGNVQGPGQGQGQGAGGGRGQGAGGGPGQGGVPASLSTEPPDRRNTSRRRSAGRRTR